MQQQENRIPGLYSGSPSKAVLKKRQIKISKDIDVIFKNLNINHQQQPKAKQPRKRLPVSYFSQNQNVLSNTLSRSNNTHHEAGGDEHRSKSQLNNY